MAEALSQSQIDELLNRMKSGEVEEEEQNQEEQIKKYDFSSPKKFTKDQLKSLNSVYENYSRVLSSYFTSILRSSCEITVSQIEEQRYNEFNNMLPDSTLIGIVSLVPESRKIGESTMMMQLPTSFGFVLIDRMLGGSGNPYIPERDYTEIELSLLNVVIKNMTSYLQEVWSSFYSLKADLQYVETNGRFLQVFSPQDVVVIITLNVDDEYYKGMGNICMSSTSLEALINSFATKYNRSSKQQNVEKEKEKQDKLFGSIKQSEVCLEAHLDDCYMSFGDISKLQVNDVISLNKKITEDLKLEIDGIPFFKARMGELDKQNAIKIVSSEENEG